MMTKMKDPWTMMYIEYADEFIEMIRQSLPDEHPLSEREFYPAAKISREFVFLIEDDTTGKSGLLDFRKKMRWKGKNVPYYKEFRDEAEIEAMIDKDHAEWVASLSRYDDV